MQIQMEKVIKSFCSFCLLVTVLVTVLTTMSSVWAQDYHSLTDISETASNYVIKKMPKEYTLESLTTGRLDSRIKLKKCQQTLIPFVSGNFRVNRNLTIGVKCSQPEWKFYVPIKAHITTEVVVANTTILRGEYISEDKLSLIKLKVNNQQSQYFRSFNDIVGKLAKRTIRADKPIKASQLQIRYLVKRKQQVIIIARNENLMVKMNGIALDNGRSNERVKVRNINSKKIIEGVVSAEGVVTVNF
jgi:flagellar basal body P-ring formation protein FlgA